MNGLKILKLDESCISNQQCPNVRLNVGCKTLKLSLLSSITFFIDLILIGTPPLAALPEEASDERWSNGVCATDGLCTSV
jgi:hypothetical protein